MLGERDARLAELGLALPGPHLPHEPLDAVVVAGGVARTSGQLPRDLHGQLVHPGTVGVDVGVEDAAEAARWCALNALSVLRDHLGSLDRIDRIVSVMGFVACTTGFDQQAAVVDGASRLLEEVFGVRGRHTRSAVGVAALPRGGAVEIEVAVALARSRPRAPLAERLLALGAATLGESGATAMDARIRPAYVGATVAGPAFTAACGSGDNLAIHVAAAEAPAGSVVVASVQGDPERGYWGEVLTTGAQARGIDGLVIEAGVRDTAALEARGFGTFSTMVSLPGASKRQPGAVGGAVQVGGVTVHAGDWIVGDADGVVVIPAQEVEQVEQAARRRAADEQRLFDALEAGATTLDLLGLDHSVIERRRA